MAKAKSSGGDRKSVKKATTKAKASAPAAKKTAKPAAGKKAPVKKTTTKTTATKTTAAAKKATTKTRGKASPDASGAPAVPMIDTNLVAESAAKMLLARPGEATEQAAPQGNKESSTFKNLKEQLAKPKPAALSNLFGHGGGEKKFGNQNFMNQQKGHNQTFGGINKAGVPRRTNG